MLMILIRKELKELITVRTLGAVVVLAVVFVLVGASIGTRDGDGATKPKTVLVVQDTGHHSEQLVSLIEGATEVIAEEEDRESGIDTLLAEDAEVVVEIGNMFTHDIENNARPRNLST